MRIGFIGTGLMGRPMATRLLTAGHEVMVYNRTREKAEALREEGARVADRPRDVLAFGEVTVLMVSDAGASAAVLGETTPAQPAPSTQVVPLPETRSPTPEVPLRTVINMSTIGPDQSQSILHWVRRTGGEYLEAPVLGSIPQAESGTLVVMVGSTPGQFEHWSPLLSHFSEKPVWIGPVGAAAALKLALNQLIGSLTAAFSFSLATVLRRGIDVETFMEILRDSALYAPTFDKKLPRMLERNFSRPNFPARHLGKDLALAVEQGRTLGIETGAVEAVERIVERALEKGWGDEDYSVLYNAVNPPE